MKFHSSPVEEHVEVPLGDGGQWEELVAHWKRRESPRRAAADAGNRCYVVSVHRWNEPGSGEAQLAEITSLVETQGDRVTGSRIYELSRPDARTLIRRGVAEQIGIEARDAGADLMVIDAELSPSQTRNLEDATGLPVSDREAVILNVFERHASTPRARIQVELAHLEYLRPRIRGIGLNMDQQAGGILGGRGPGETASELFARRIDGRLADLRRKLAQLKVADAAQRKHRARCSRVVLVGYTNAGKTSLMNALTEAGLSARDRPFETLDTTSRSLSRHGGDVLLSDTVGFIRRLPERLFASFESTFAEVAEASLLLVVVDSSDPEFVEHLQTTETVLERLGATAIPRMVILNKADLLDEPLSEVELSGLGGRHPTWAVSSRDPVGVSALRESILRTARADHAVRQVFVPDGRSEITASIYSRCRVLQTVAAPTGTQFLIEGEAHVVGAIARACRKRRD